jgi:hypothetical protein
MMDDIDACFVEDNMTIDGEVKQVDGRTLRTTVCSH